MKAYKEYQSPEAYKQAVLSTAHIGECTKPPAPKPGEGVRYVFISYSHKDYKKVFCELADLYESGVPFWYDDRLRAGTAWNEDARKHLESENCAGVIFFLSPDFFASEAIKEEIRMTLGEGRQLPKDYFCVNLTDAKPSALYKSVGEGAWKKELASAFRDEDTYLCFGEPEHARRLTEQICENFGIAPNCLLYDLGRARSGSGVIEFEHGSVYEGPFSGGKFEGLGQLAYSGVPFYDGQWKEGKPHGLGIRTCANGTVFVGEWVSGRLNGSGIRVGNNGMAHYGNWVAGKLEGLGAVVAADGSVFTGNWVDGRHVGAWTLSDMDEIRNDWLSAIVYGRACEAQADKDVLRFSSGAVYRGQTRQNRPHGVGTMTYEDGTVYEGRWVSGIPHGTGKMTYVEGDIYEGQWVAGIPHGTGKMTYGDGDIYEGDWEAGAWHGTGTLTLSDGTKQVGRYEDGAFIAPGK